MKHILPFVAGLVAFMVISSVYYMGIMSWPSSACVVPEAEMNMAMMLLGNALMVGLAGYMIQLGGQFGMTDGAKHGAVAGLVANGMLNVFVYSFFTCNGDHIFPLGEAIQDVVVNIVFMAAAGAAMAAMYARGAKG